MASGDLKTVHIGKNLRQVSTYRAEMRILKDVQKLLGGEGHNPVIEVY